MITDEGKYYLYRHIRLDTGEVFYVGIGTKDFIATFTGSYEREYKRAFDIKSRTKFWKRIVAKTNYRVEIIFETNDYYFLELKEREFISLYGRRCKKKGSLVNFEEGGKRDKNYLHTPKVRAKMEKTRMKTLEAKIKYIYQYNLQGNLVKKWKNMREIALNTSYNKSFIRHCCNKKYLKAYGFVWSYEEIVFNKFLLELINVKENDHKNVYINQYTLEGEFIREWRGLINAGNTLNINPFSISNCCRKISKSAGGFKWKYKEKIC